MDSNTGTLCAPPLWRLDKFRQLYLQIQRLWVLFLALGQRELKKWPWCWSCTSTGNKYWAHQETEGLHCCREPWCSCPGARLKCPLTSWEIHPWSRKFTAEGTLQSYTAPCFPTLVSGQVTTLLWPCPDIYVSAAMGSAAGVLDGGKQMRFFHHFSSPLHMYPFYPFLLQQSPPEKQHWPPLKNDLRTQTTFKLTECFWQGSPSSIKTKRD